MRDASLTAGATTFLRREPARAAAAHRYRHNPHLGILGSCARRLRAGLSQRRLAELAQRRVHRHTGDAYGVAPTTIYVNVAGITGKTFIATIIVPHGCICTGAKSSAVLSGADGVCSVG